MRRTAIPAWLIAAGWLTAAVALAQPAAPPPYPGTEPVPAEVAPVAPVEPLPSPDIPRVGGPTDVPPGSTPQSAQPPSPNDPGVLRPTPPPPPPVRPPPPGPAQTPASSTGTSTVDGHLREGAFLSSPGSLAFIIHHTLMGAAGGFITQGIGNSFRFDEGAREAMVVGTVLGSLVGFGGSTWWQFNHWVSLPTAYFGIAHSLFSGMAFTGLVNLFSDDLTLLAWAGFIGAELGAWLTAILGTGELPVWDGLLISSSAFWAAAYTGLILAVIGNSGVALSDQAILNALLIAPGVGAGAAALATLGFHATTAQVLRANLFGAGIGGAVLVISGLLLGFNTPTPYLLGLGTSAAAIAAVSLFWDASAERSAEWLDGRSGRGRRYSGVW